MTRINANIKMCELTDQHLIAEHRELPRICKIYTDRLAKNAIPTNADCPEFKLGSGHVMFFVNKGLFTYERYMQLYDECMLRGFAVTAVHSNWNAYQSAHFNRHIFTDQDNDLIRSRIADRIIHSNQKPRYKGVTIAKSTAINLLQFSNINDQIAMLNILEQHESK